MYVDNNGIVRFENTDDLSPLHVQVNTALGSVSLAIDNRLEHLNADNVVEGRLGIAHRPEGLPFAMAAGMAQVSTPSGGGVGTTAVVFPPDRFTQTPKVTASVWTTAPNRRSVSIWSISRNGMELRAWADNQTTLDIDWIAIQMLEHDGEG